MLKRSSVVNVYKDFCLTLMKCFITDDEKSFTYENV